MSSFWDNEELLGKIQKNSKEEVHVKKVSKNYKEYVDIRTFWMDNESGEFRPSQKGVAIPLDSIDVLKTILDKV